MKKFLAMIVAGAMLFGMSTVAMADDVSYTPTEATSFTVNKTYTSTATDEIVPNETLTFTVEADDDNPDTPVIVVGTENTYTVTGKANSIPVTIPSYDTAGVYDYTITEEAGNAAGVTYDTEKTIHVKVLVGYDNDNKALKIENVTSYIAKINGEKVDTFENKFETGSFTVEKQVQGNLANQNDAFEITVTLTSDKEILTPILVGGVTVGKDEWTKNGTTYTYTSIREYAAKDGKLTFSDIPYGVSVSVKETETEMNGYESKGVTNGTFTVGNEAKEVVVTNEKGTTVETGIHLDNIPYVLILAVVVLAAAVVIITRRRYRAM